ncbi:MAG: DUF4270 family protein [Bacteroidetes bacterium]|jgi:hypothetical protein|nr:DUF4270 family protein [Bacteroidota bacterium]
MKFFRLDLLTLLISLFILNSCKNKDSIGLGADSSAQLNGSLIDTSTVIVNTMPDIGNPLSKDSIATSGLTKIPFGYLNDPVFGTVETNVALALNLPGQTTYSLPSGTIAIDSAVLVMPYADGFYGDSLTSKYKVNVYQLANRIKSVSYYNTDSWATQGTILGTRTFFARTHDSIQRYNIITGQPDTLIKVPAQLRIPIDKDFVNAILFYAPSAQLSSNSVFLNNVKGLYLTMDKTGSSGAGGTFMFSSSDSLNVYYRTINGTTIDTAMVTLPITTHVSQIKQTSSNTLTTEFADSTSSRDQIYLQGMAGTKVRIKFPFLKSLTSTLGPIVVNRAELVVTPSPGSTIPFRPLPKLTMYRYDIAHQIVELQDANPNDPRYISPATFGGYYSRAINSYHFVITGYVQDLINGKVTDYGTYLAPIDTVSKTTVEIAPTTQMAGRLVAVGTPASNSPNYPYRIKLNIIYTKIK